jgi:hypothetical protein
VTAKDVPGDMEIAVKLRERTTEELISFQKKINKVNTPQATVIRLYLVKELLHRYCLDVKPG